jgi:pilus assembly protein CpaC
MSVSKRLRRIASALTIAAAIAPAAGAQAQIARVTGTSENVHAGQLAVAVHQSQVLRVDRPFAQALVGDDKIADVLPLTNQSLYVLGKRAGTTSLTVYDRNRNLLAVMDVVVGPDIVTLKRQLSELVPGEKIDVRLSNGAIVLTGVVSNGVAAQRAVQIAETYASGDAEGGGGGGASASPNSTGIQVSIDTGGSQGGGAGAEAAGRGKVINLLSVGSTQQVMLEVRFSEMRRGAARQLGFNHAFLSNSGDFQGGIGSNAPSTALLTNQNGVPTINLQGILESFGIVGASYRFAGLNILSAMDALERNGVVTTLAEPTLIALSGETASFLAGGEFPIPVLQAFGGGAGTGNNGGGSGITIEFKPFGVGLAFTPTVLADGVISLVVAPEVSSIDPAASITVNGLTIPGLSVRRAKTTIELHDGQSFAMAGLLRRDFSSTVRRFPVLGSIPVIGTLFRSTGFQNDDTELVIIVTPRLVKPVSRESLQLPSERVLPPNEAELFLLGRTDSKVTPDPVLRNEVEQPVTRAAPTRPAGSPDPHLLEEPKP